MYSKKGAVRDAVDEANGGISCLNVFIDIALSIFDNHDFS